MKDAANQNTPIRQEEQMDDSSETHIIPKNHQCQDVQVNFCTMKMYIYEFVSRKMYEMYMYCT